MEVPPLYRVHRWLITSFAVFSGLFGAWAIWRGGEGGDGAALGVGIGSLVVCAGCLVYLRRSTYLKR